jgi:anthranilate synthase component 1
MSDQHASEVYARTRVRIDGKTVPTSADFAELAATRRVIPVVRKLLADTYTPVGLYQRLARNAPGTYLLESAENGRTWSRYSFVGVRCAGLLTEVDGRACWVGDVPSDVAQALDDAAASDGDPLSAIRDALELLHSERIPGLPPLTSGLVGMIGYDAGGNAFPTSPTTSWNCPRSPSC